MQELQARVHGKHNKKVVLLIGGWTYRQWLLWLPAKILTAHGYYCVVYTYPNSVFSPDYQKTVAELLKIKNKVLRQITQLKTEGHDTFYIFGTSLGSVLATLVANESPDVSKIILNTVGADVAESVWSWDLVKAYFKKDLVRRGMTRQKLVEAWKPIGPIYNLGGMRGKKFLVYLAEKDRLIPRVQGKGLVRVIKSRGLDCQVIINHHLPHSTAGVYNLLQAQRYLKFLAK